ncbi:5-oxoprolinase subunit PxpA [Jeotgalibacillus proteolyticus]|uniref:5-oxoprolinase subunit A n=1 Tax=Jeotgalibacillus proteolyticus TaxID=2082395 RepID=A0A2S5GA62_9BACL|nr:5-oxoprolinase subunit PxpA [Jeotgalibacillus proteolyticus]PPA69892.1 LamB/YcsF family protein [Jeotgalibacillus proteolyticus]
MLRVDLNCDMGESFGAYKMGNDSAILDYVTSANIACGFHAGDPSTMKKTVNLALEKGVGIGAHPGFDDVVGFGRRNIAISPEEAYDLVVYQIGALYGFVKASGAKMQHVKPHGALYNMAARDPLLSEAIAKAVWDVDPELVLFGLSGGELVKAGEKRGLKTASEVFSDRTYQVTGELTSRKEANALIEDDSQAVSQVVRMIKEKQVQAVTGKDISIQADTVCIHGDGAHALSFAEKINETLRAEGVELLSIGVER